MDLKTTLIDTLHSFSAYPLSWWVAIIIMIFAAYNGLSIGIWVLVLALFFTHFEPSLAFWIGYLICAAIFIIPQTRISLISSPLLKFITKLNLLPKISNTEKIVLTSGTIWIDGELFSGRPNFKSIFANKYSKLSAEEQSFLDNEVEELCKMCSDDDIHKKRDLDEKLWQFLKEKKFFGMIVPKKYGGLEFSAYAHSAVIEKLSSRSVTLSITAMVPNSLGPAELLLHYGTEKQKDYYLPRLANGTELPCFALTEPTAGSDATSIKSEGVLFKDEDGEIKIRLNWSKRYITLGAVATVIGVAFRLRDPEKLLSNQEDIGITCALIPNNTPGVRQGRRHDPLATPFINSPIDGKNVVVTLDAIIGGKAGVGKGWKMLMECLSAGRGISLPSVSSGGCKLVSRVVSAYATIREQFGLTLAKFEGVEEVLTRIAARTYTVDAIRELTVSSVDAGAKPSVVTAIAKYHATELFRQVINDGMDLMAGKGIIRGPRNLLANAYFSAPISITVEGANIMTRSLILFGQGAIMCHPYIYKEFEAIEKGDIKAFDGAFFGHLKHLIQNFTRSILLSLTRGHIHSTHRSGISEKYERKIAWASATFALLADLALIRYGGALKRKERISGRFGDILSFMYLAVCVLKKFEENGFKPEEEPVVELAMVEIFNRMQTAFELIYKNLFEGIGRFLLFPFAVFARFNTLGSSVSDQLITQVGKNFNEEFRNKLTAGIFVPSDSDEALGKLELAYTLSHQVGAILKKIKLAAKSGVGSSKSLTSKAANAFEQGIISIEEKKLLEQYITVALDAIQVDDYPFKTENKKREE